MKLTKYTHACVRLEQDGRVLVLDPGVFSEAAEALAGAGAVLITHEHADHLDADAVTAALAADPALTVHAPAGVAAELRSKAPEAAERIIDAVPGQSFDAAGFAVRTFGGQHALIHPAIPVVANIGYLIEENVFHPGDSFTVPDGLEVKTLLVPLHAPWSKVGEVIDFVVAVRAPKAYPVHDSLLTETGRTMVEGHVQRIGSRYGSSYEHLDPRQTVEV
ncbi:MBL fold metallo-hydrolase [Paenarthrobacter sp. DKR-5]|uniref:MBL fold metallo-hydrolase n=1 Tax=Paenarthrobacter sp. DKR-5 TaxID=2835535 RepID=UPI001BDBF214|nr:MBL fold metallo-hydrolase [Paenarthrobacter sp. DKR-5]MBT1003094.1 MBL fold metallo-hydrolase [Paenarthrobacter sp. DKR-5]